MVISVAILTGSNTHFYPDASKSINLVRVNFEGQRGVYIWTNLINNQQYVGCSNNLGTRLGDYGRQSYLNTQSNRGSLISKALLKYGYSNFSLQVQVLGTSFTKSELATYVDSNTIPDYAVLEQSFLDSHHLAYNVKRDSVPGPHVPSNKPINVGSANPSYGRTGTNAYAWDRQHSEEDRKQWSKTRGSIKLWVYNVSTFELVIAFNSRSALSSFFGMSKAFGSKLAKQISATLHQAVIYGNYIVTTVPLTVPTLQSIVQSLTVIPVIPKRVHKSHNILIYGKNVETGVIKTWQSKEDCTKELTGRDFVNKSTINRRIDNNLPYLGYILQTKPFNKD